MVRVSIFFISFLTNISIGLLIVGPAISQKNDPCEKIKDAVAHVSLFANDSSFRFAVTNIKNSYGLNGNEHCISFGKDAAGNIISSPLSNGAATSGKVPAITNAFADLHNHPNNLPPDAGDLYGLININKNNTAYKTRFVVTQNGTVYALMITDTAAALAFTLKYPAQPPAGGQPAFPVELVDEAREMKYQYNCTDEMTLAFLLEKYKAGVSLLKQNPHGTFTKLYTTVSRNKDRLAFRMESCP